MLNYIRNRMVEDYLMSMSYFHDHGNDDVVGQISGFVQNGIQKLPWFYRIPVKSFMIFVGIVNMATQRPSKKGLSEIVKKIPFYNMANKLIRTMTLMILFDVCPIKTGNQRFMK